MSGKMIGTSFANSIIFSYFIIYGQSMQVRSKILLESKSREVSSVLRVLCANRRQRPLSLSLVLGAKFPTVLYTSMYPSQTTALVSLEINFLPVRYQLRSRVVFPKILELTLLRWLSKYQPSIWWSQWFGCMLVGHRLILGWRWRWGWKHHLTW